MSYSYSVVKCVLLCILLVLIVYIILNHAEQFGFFDDMYKKVKDRLTTNKVIKQVQDTGEKVRDLVKNPNLLLDSKNMPSRLIAEFLQKYGEYEIVGIKCCRLPVPKAIKYIFNILTLGEFQERLNIRGIDDIFHLWIVLTLTDGKHTFDVRFDKNEIVEYSIKPERLKAKDCVKIDVKWGTKLITLFNNAIKVHPVPGFWLYDAKNNNCQIFVQSLLNGSGYYTPKAREFVFQPADEILENLGIAEKIGSDFPNIIANVKKHFLSI
jgi:hypothetical protein